MEIYQPAEDSEFFANFLRGYFSKISRDIRFLDVGTGSGILVDVALEFLDKKNVFACDLNKEAVKIVAQKGINAYESNLFSNVSGKFDLIVFNAPYLPKDNREPASSRVATTGGKKGDEISVRFLKEAKKHLNKDGKILLLISSLTPRDKIDEFKGREVARKKMFMENLLLLQIDK